MWISSRNALANCDHLAGFVLKFNPAWETYTIYAQCPFLGKTVLGNASDPLCAIPIVEYNEREKAEDVFKKLTAALAGGAKFFHMPTEEEMCNDDD